MKRLPDAPCLCSKLGEGEQAEDIRLDGDRGWLENLMGLLGGCRYQAGWGYRMVGNG